ncbi:MAG: class I fructose-bisphosphate aldolase [Candidatus Asgardarchaeia archaeon]
MQFNVGKIIRTGHILNRRTKRVVIVAMDHGSFAGPMKGIEKPGETIKKVIDGGADAMLLPPGIVSKFADIISGNIGVIMRIDGGSTIYSPETDRPKSKIICSVERAVKLGADAIIAMAWVGAPNESELLAQFAKIAQEGHEYGLPVFAETLLIGMPKIESVSDPKAVSVATRVAAELGADFIKTHYTGDPETFKTVVEGTPAPLVILGGPKRDTIKEVLNDVKGAIDAGAIGVAFGRNIWQADDPAKMVRAITKIVHDRASVEEALNELK